MDKRDPLQRRLACLGDPSRFRILAALQAGRLCVSELAQVVRLSQSCTTRHLQALSAVGVVRPEREGRRVVYVIREEDDQVAGLLGWLAGAAGPPHPATPPARPAGRRPTGRQVAVGLDAAGPAIPAAEPPAVAPALTDPPPAGEVASQADRVDETRGWRRPSDLEDFLL